MKSIHLILILAVTSLCAECESKENLLYPKDAVRFSQDFIISIKSEMPYEAFRDTLRSIDLDQLSKDLITSDQKLAFWINTYNAMVQTKIRDNQEAFKDQETFFKTADQELGTLKVSLDDIETGILRRKKVDKNSKFVDRFKVDVLDPRIHFTLNCGATSCPPIAFYSVENLNNDLALAEESFVTQTSKYSKATNTLEISELFNWFEEDFGGKEGVLTLMKRLKIIDEETNPTIAYTPYDWNLDLENE